jgi:hypothetical protein
MASLFKIFGSNLDIIYPDDLHPPESLGYKMVVYWNDTRLIPTETPSQSATSQQPTQTLNNQPSTPFLFYVVGASVLVAISIGIIVSKIKKGYSENHST